MDAFTYTRDPPKENFTSNVFANNASRGIYIRSSVIFFQLFIECYTYYLF